MKKHIYGFAVYVHSSWIAIFNLLGAGMIPETYGALQAKFIASLVLPIP